MTRRVKYAFSLVELSIVLVILGLLTGAILSGQSLIHGAQLRSVTADMQNYSTAMHGFRDRYFAIPGDMANATQFWGSAGGNGNMAMGLLNPDGSEAGSSGDSACDNAMTAASPKVCNGNGDGLIESTIVATLGGPPNYAWNQVYQDYTERFTAWKELANAGLIDGAYSGQENPAYQSSWGVSGRGQPVPTPGDNVPLTKLTNAAYTFAASASATTGYINAILVQGIGNGNYNAVLSPEDVWNIDTKLDDGKPGTGIVFTNSQAQASCATVADPTTSPSTAQYNLSNTNKVCNFFYGLP